MTKAQQFLQRWRDDSSTCMDPADWAREIDPKVRCEGFLYTGRIRFIFSDCSQAVYSNSCLTVTK